MIFARIPDPIESMCVRSCVCVVKRQKQSVAVAHDTRHTKLELQLYSVTPSKCDEVQRVYVCGQFLWGSAPK